MNLTNITLFDKIVKCMEGCILNNREPVILLINPLYFSELKKDIRLSQLWGMSPLYMGMEVIITSQIQDFRVVDNRLWYELDVFQGKPIIYKIGKETYNDELKSEI